MLGEASSTPASSRQPPREGLGISDTPRLRREVAVRSVKGDELGDLKDSAIFVNGIPNHWPTEDLEAVFGAFGKVEHSTVHPKQVG